MALETAIETIIQFTLISSVVSFGIANVKGALENDGWYDEMMLGVGVAICATFDITLIEAISGKVPAMSEYFYPAATRRGIDRSVVLHPLTHFPLVGATMERVRVPLLDLLESHPGLVDRASPAGKISVRRVEH